MGWVRSGRTLPDRGRHGFVIGITIAASCLSSNWSLRSTRENYDAPPLDKADFDPLTRDISWTWFASTGES